MVRILDYEIIKELGLTVEVLSGEINMDDYLCLKEREIKDIRYIRDCNVIADFRNARFKTEGKNMTEEINRYISTVKTYPDLPGKGKSAFISNTPMQVAILTLYQIISDLPVTTAIFNTLTAATNWLEYRHDEIQDIENILYRMRFIHYQKPVAERFVKEE